MWVVLEATNKWLLLHNMKQVKANLGDAVLINTSSFLLHFMPFESDKSLYIHCYTTTIATAAHNQTCKNRALTENASETGEDDNKIVCSALPSVTSLL